MIRMFFLLPLIFMMVLFGGCATTTQQAQVQYVQACGVYSSLFSTAVQLRSAGKLNAAQVSAISQVDAQITPICSGPLPTDLTIATQKVTTAITTLGLLGVIQATTTQEKAK